MGRAERSLCLASLGGFLSCPSPTDIVPGVSPASPYRGAGVGLTHPGDVIGSRCLVVPRDPTQDGGCSTLPGGYFHPKRLVSATPRHRDERGGAASGRGKRRKGCGLLFFPLPSFVPSLLHSALPSHNHRAPGARSFTDTGQQDQPRVSLRWDQSCPKMPRFQLRQVSFADRTNPPSNNDVSKVWGFFFLKSPHPRATAACRLQLGGAEVWVPPVLQTRTDMGEGATRGNWDVPPSGR